VSTASHASERPVLISGNWKMFENHFEALKLVQELGSILRATPMPAGREASLHPPFTSLRTVQTAIESDHLPLQIGAQTCHFEDRGAYTGEISPEMLAKLNVAYVIAGHSERRRYCGETDEIVRLKVDAITRHGMRPIVCVGESLEQRLAGEAVEFVRAQVAAVFNGRSAAMVASSVVAYEPIWAIGTGETATADDAEEMCAAIRAELAQHVGASAEATRIQYGGSASEDNAAELLRGENVDGLLVGGASLDAQRFAAIIAAGA
jgi:triosephosphate isomerase